MRRSIALFTLTLLAACQATMGDADDTVATFSLYADKLEALVAKECVDMYGSEQQCTPYPNQLQCDRMGITVKADGRTLLRCVKDGRLIRSGPATVGEVPYMCKASKDMRCVLCLDIYGNTIHDSCNRGAQLFRGGLGGFQNLPAGSGYLVEPGGGTSDSPDAAPLDTAPPDAGAPTPSNPPLDGGQAPSSPPPSSPPETPAPGDGSSTPSPGGPASGNGRPDVQGNDGDASGSNGSATSPECDVDKAFLLYAHKLNQLLAHEGLDLSWSPEAAKKGDPTKGFLYSSQEKHKESCEAFTKSFDSDMSECVRTKNGECYFCKKVSVFKKSHTSCRCYRITLAAVKAACAEIPPSCDGKAWSGALVMSYGVATKWLFAPSYSGWFFGKPAPGTDTGKFPKCQGSPLVLDLAGDGIEPTAPAAGVRFDLLGFGELQTAWIQGDDALLALDRDGNGRIDSGAELFGEATDGGPHRDGFAALAALDDNGDGKLDTRDPAFSRLLLWQDANGDGQSQRDELRALGQAGVRSLGLSCSAGPGSDPHGNDLALRGSFTRADGSSGQMVDVFFATGR